MESCVWLEKHLAEYPAILVLVSHSEVPPLPHARRRGVVRRGEG